MVHKRSQEVCVTNPGVSEVRTFDRCVTEVGAFKVHPREVRPPDVCLEEVCAFKVRPREVSPRELAPGEVCVVEVCAPEVRPGEVRPFEVCATEVRSYEVRPSEICGAEVHIEETHPGEGYPGEIRSGADLLHPRDFRIKTIRPHGLSVPNSPFEVRPCEIRLSEVCFPEARPSEVRPSEVRPAEVRLSEVCFPEVRPFEVRSWFDRVAVDLHDNHATGRPAGLPCFLSWPDLGWLSSLLVCLVGGV